MLSANACYAAVPVEPAPLYIIGNIVPYDIKTLSYTILHWSNVKLA